jgi:hypothetical protein
LITSDVKDEMAISVAFIDGRDFSVSPSEFDCGSKGLVNIKFIIQTAVVHGLRSIGPTV